jgi:hypothetical protein
MRILLDSSTLLRDPTRTRAATRTIERLAAAGRLHVNIPDVVIREVRANLKAQVEQEIARLRSAVSGLKRRLPPPSIPSSVADLENAVDEALEDALTIPVAAFDSWLNTIGAVKDPIAEADGQAVMDAYFEGKPPFKESRHREDIPDAFILESIKRLASTEPLAIVISDDRLRMAVAATDNVSTYSSLDDLIATDGIQRLLGDAASAANMAILARLAPEHNASISAALDGAHVDIISGESITSPAISGDNNDATITIVDSLRDLRLEWTDAEYYGADNVIVPVAFLTNVYADSYIFKADWYAMTDEETKNIGITDHNEHYFEAEAEYEVEVRGKMSLALGIDLAEQLYDAQDFEDALQNAQVALDSVDDIEVIADGTQI